MLIRQVADEYVVKATYKSFVYKNEIKHGENKLGSVIYITSDIMIHSCHLRHTESE